MSWVWAFAFIALGALAGLVSLALVTTKRLPREEEDDVVPVRETWPAFTSIERRTKSLANQARRRARKAQRKARRKQRGR